MARRCILFVTIFFIFAPFIHGLDSEECSEGFQTPGVTIPKGDIEIEYENPLEVYCRISDKYLKEYGPNASEKLAFYRYEEKLPREMVEIVNSTTIRLFIKKPPVSKAIFYCKIHTETKNDSLVCFNSVIVGTKPKNVTDFRCISMNYENLTCEWTAPHNYVNTTYTLSYHFQGRSSRIMFSCPKLIASNNSGLMKCFWNIETEPHYRQAQRIYFFNLTMSNVFGTNMLLEKFHHFQNVIPGPPDNLTLVNTTKNSITIKWSVPPSMKNFPPGVMHRVLYQSEYENRDNWLLSDIISKEKLDDIVYTLKDLKYAHAHYDIRVSIKSRDAEMDNEQMWSRNSSIVVTTASAIPGAPPKTTLGSFEILDKELYIYWQQISVELQNGENFSYNVKVLDSFNNFNHSIKATEVTNAYAKFKNLNTQAGYTFIVESMNEVGSSQEKSRVYVPQKVDRVPEPLSFTKIAYDNGVYELSWYPPKRNESITNYTIFWCENKRDRPYQCEGQLNWTTVDSSVSVKKLTLPETKVYQFAISANSERSSSGMVWAACTVIHNKSFGQMKSVWISKVGPTFIEVNWKLECSDRIGSVDGFIVYYCPIVSPKESVCRGPQQKLNVSGISMHANVSKLKPYTTYMLTVSAVSKHNTQSQPSEPMFNTTLEAAPDSYPQDLDISNITNTSMVVRWMPPAAKNGVIRYYLVSYNHHMEKVNSHSLVDNVTEIVLNSLESYQTYNVSVKACTVSCSDTTPIKSVKTLMGVPGGMEKPYASTKNDSYVEVEWKRPQVPRGKVDSYELRIRMPENDTQYKTVNDTRFKFDGCMKDNTKKTFHFSVRAINILNDGTVLQGPWSDETENFCSKPSPSIALYILLGTVIIVLIGASVYFAPKCKDYYKEKKNIKVVLPDGFNNNMMDHLADTSEEPQIEYTIKDTIINQGREPLLHPMLDKTLTGSRDSSGCSSGNQSGTPSLDSEPHLSDNISDSGTEQTISPALDESTNSLRRRQGASTDGGYVQMPPDQLAQQKLWGKPLQPPATAAAAGNYCVIGVNQSPEERIMDNVVGVKKSMSPYVTAAQLPAVTAASTGYIALNNAGSKQSIGVVPSLQQQQQNNSAAYVKAGNDFMELLPSSKNIVVDDDHDFVVLDAEQINPKSDEEIKLEASKPSSSYVQVANVSDVAPTSYVKTGDILGLKPQQQQQTSTPKGYVAFGEVPPSVKSHHRQYDGKSLKKD